MQSHETLISAEELLAGIDEPNLCIVDCRFDLMQPEKGRREFLDGHIPGAVYAHLDNDLADPDRPDSGRHPLPDPDRFASTLGSWGISNAVQVVAYDQASGAIASRLWWLLRWLGHSSVAVLDGGLDAWTRAGGPLSGKAANRRPVEFRGQPNPAMVVNTAEIVHEPGALLLVDARDTQRFLGRVEPIDPVAGHVPGAISLPFAECLAPDGRFLGAGAVRRRLQRALDNAPQAPWAVMCGSGVTACHLALSAAHAGIEAPRLYAGSWSEWIRDPSRPVATEAS
jgi:thiosulfate/3-mercaptopyruvate sulfurtransferase